MRIATLTLTITPLLFTLGCQSAQVGLGPEAVALYDLAKADGMLEIELDREGRLLEIEADIDVDQLPPHVVAVATERAGTDQIVGAEREHGADGSGWEVKLMAGDVEWEVIVDASGRVVETERTIEASDAPQVVRDAATARVREHTGGDGILLSIEMIERDGSQEYHVKRVVDGVSYKCVLAPTGEVLRTVREHRAEIEIPLR